MQAEDLDELLDGLRQDLVGAEGDPMGRGAVSGYLAVTVAVAMAYQKRAEMTQAVRSQADEANRSVSMW